MLIVALHIIKHLTTTRTVFQIVTILFYSWDLSLVVCRHRDHPVCIWCLCLLPQLLPLEMHLLLLLLWFLFGKETKPLIYYCNWQTVCMLPQLNCNVLQLFPVQQSDWMAAALFIAFFAEAKSKYILSGNWLNTIKINESHAHFLDF